MSSADYKFLSITNVAAHNPDGSYVKNGAIFTVSSGSNKWTNDIYIGNGTFSSLHGNIFTASTFTISTLAASTTTISSLTATTLTVTNRIINTGAFVNTGGINARTILASGAVIMNNTLTASSIITSTLTVNGPITASSLVTASSGVSTTTLSTTGLLTAAAGISTTALTTSDVLTANLGISTNTLFFNPLININDSYNTTITSQGSNDANSAKAIIFTLSGSPVMTIQSVYNSASQSIISSVQIPYLKSNNGTGTIYGDTTGVLGQLSPSDRSLKTNINPLSNQLHIISQLNPISFNWLNKDASSTINFGFIAQEVCDILPNICDILPNYSKTGSSTIMGYDPVSLIPVLTASIKELSTIVAVSQANYQSTLDSYQIQLSTLTSRIS
jgi:hypothetical protein